MIEYKIIEEEIIQVNKNYRIVVDSLQYIVEELQKIDPRKSPAYKPSGEEPKIRYEWKTIGYYGLTISGLTSALKSIVVHQNNKKRKKTDIGEYVKELKETAEKINELVSVYTEKKVKYNKKRGK